MIQELILVGSCLAALVILLVWAAQSERRPRHTSAGAGALTVACLLAQREREQHTGELFAWPRTDPDATPPGGADRTEAVVAPSFETMRRIRNALHRL